MKKIICYGDSITYGYRVGSGRQVEMPYPKALGSSLGNDYEVINEGHSGWRSTTALRNLKYLVLDKKPDIVFLMFGINDALGSEYGKTKTFIEFSNNVLEMYNTCKTNGINTYILVPTPTIWPRVEEFSYSLKEFCLSENLNVLDLHDQTLKLIEKNQLQIDDCIADGVHFADDKYALLAKALQNLINL